MLINAKRKWEKGVFVNKVTKYMNYLNASNRDKLYWNDK